MPIPSSYHFVWRGWGLGAPVDGFHDSWTF